MNREKLYKSVKKHFPTIEESKLIASYYLNKFVKEKLNTCLNQSKIEIKEEININDKIFVR